MPLSAFLCSFPLSLKNCEANNLNARCAFGEDPTRYYFYIKYW